MGSKSKIFSEKPDSNQRPIELQSIALPLSYPRLMFPFLNKEFMKAAPVRTFFSFL
jgi:hypothetical protein